MDELRPIPGFDGYSITADGRVWSHPKSWVHWNGSAMTPKSHGGKWLRGTRDGYGYIVMNLAPRKRSLVHRLVALAWIPNDDPARKTAINHLNAVKDDNRVSNLEWCTTQRNCQHAMDLGLNPATPRRLEICRAMGISTRKLTFAQAEEIRARVDRGQRRLTMASLFHISRQCVDQIVSRKTYVQPDRS